MFGDPKESSPKIKFRFGAEAVSSSPVLLGVEDAQIGFPDVVDGWLFGEVAGVALRAGGGKGGVVVRAIEVVEKVEVSSTRLCLTCSISSLNSFFAHFLVALSGSLTLNPPFRLASKPPPLPNSTPPPQNQPNVASPLEHHVPHSSRHSLFPRQHYRNDIISAVHSSTPQSSLALVLQPHLLSSPSIHLPRH